MKILFALASLFLIAFAVHAQTPEAAPRPPSATARSSRRITPGTPMFPPIRSIRARTPTSPASTQDAEYLHADFGEDPDYGIPYVVVDQVAAVRADHLHRLWRRERPRPLSDPEGCPGRGGRRCPCAGGRYAGTARSTRLYDAEYNGKGWDAGSGAVFDLRSNDLRPEGWTSADAAGLPIFPGLVRYDEVMAGAIHHALRFTVDQSQAAYIHPATHYASDDDDPESAADGLAPAPQGRL